MRSRPRVVLAVAACAHFIHDGFSDILYVLLPLWAVDFGLALTQVGVMRTTYTVGMALFQIPAGLLAERWGERVLLAVGTAVTAGGFIAAGWAGGFAALLGILLLAGLGSGVQHPLSSSLVSKAYEAGPRRGALGTYNFSGDLGKITVAAAMGLAVAAIGWRAAVAGYGGIGLLGALAIWVALARLRAGDPEPRAAEGPEPVAGWGIRDVRGFQALAAVGMIDTATRTGFLTFLPFALVAKGSTVAGVGAALALIFAGGAVGKLVCGFLAERIGVIRTVVLTEAATALGIGVIVLTPLTVALAVLPPIGLALNGTSSVLYGTVADLVRPERHSRAYGLYYTLIVGASSLSPILYGILGDLVGVSATLVIIGALVLVTIPLCVALRGAVAVPATAR